MRQTKRVEDFVPEYVAEQRAFRTSVEQERVSDPLCIDEDSSQRTRTTESEHTVRLEFRNADGTGFGQKRHRECARGCTFGGEVTPLQGQSNGREDPAHGVLCLIERLPGGRCAVDHVEHDRVRASRASAGGAEMR